MRFRNPRDGKLTVRVLATGELKVDQPTRGNQSPVPHRGPRFSNSQLPAFYKETSVGKSLVL